MYHNGLTPITLPRVDNVRDRVTFNANQALGRDDPRVLGRPYEDDVARAHQAEPGGDPLGEKHIAGDRQSRDHAGAVGLHAPDHESLSFLVISPSGGLELMG